MQRKLVKQGQNALTVTLPAKWTKSKGLQAGDVVEIEEAKNQLVISTKDGQQIKTREIIITNETTAKYLRSIIASVYKAGYSEIILHINTKKKLPYNAMVQTFTGLEIVESSERKIKISSFLSIEETKTYGLVLKMFQMIRVLIRTIEDEWNKVDATNVQNTVKNNIMRLRDHCLRSIHMLQFGGDSSYDYYDFVTTLQKISGELYNLTLFITKNKIEKTKLIGESIAILDKIYEAYQKKNYAITQKVFKATRDYNVKYFDENSLKKTLRKENPGLVAHFYHLNLLFRRLSSRLTNLSEY